MSGDVQQESPGVRWEPEPKPAGGVRWLVRLPAADDAEYREAVGVLARRVERALGDQVYASRVRDRGVGPASVIPEPWRAARRRFAQRARMLARTAGMVARTDVRDCYGTITDAALAAHLQRLGAGPTEVARVLRALARLHEQGVAGLPVGPPASAVLANAVLLRADRALAAAGVAHLRWVDDVLVFCRDEREAARSLERLSGSLAATGLSIAEDKTGLVRGPGELASLLRGCGLSGTRAPL